MHQDAKNRAKQDTFGDQKIIGPGTPESNDCSEIFLDLVPRPKGALDF